MLIGGQVACKKPLPIQRQRNMCYVFVWVMWLCDVSALCVWLCSVRARFFYLFVNCSGQDWPEFDQAFIFKSESEFWPLNLSKIPKILGQVNRVKNLVSFSFFTISTIVNPHKVMRVVRFNLYGCYRITIFSNRVLTKPKYDIVLI